MSINMVLFMTFYIAQTTHLLIKTYNIISNILYHRKQNKIPHRLKFVVGERNRQQQGNISKAENVAFTLQFHLKFVLIPV